MQISKKLFKKTVLAFEQYAASTLLFEFYEYDFISSNINIHVSGENIFEGRTRNLIYLKCTENGLEIKLFCIQFT